MFSESHAYSTVTAILPEASTRTVVPALLQDGGTSALIWNARGTLLHDHWWRRWFPPISPAKNILQIIAPDDDVARIVSTVVDAGKLHQQATGAVYSTPCEHVYFGSDFHVWPPREGASLTEGHHKLTENLSAIYCIVDHAWSDRVSKAAINAGSHGPIVYYTEGRGLRDRLGWLRITKQHEKELMLVIADQNDADEVFDAMAHAGALHLPGHGFMYRQDIDRGMFNIPSRVSHHHYDANIHQIINAIDHLSGHSHWRDQAAFDVGPAGRGVGLETLKQDAPIIEEQVCLSAIAPRDHCPQVMDMLLDAGAPGLNINYANFTKDEGHLEIANAQLNHEYGLLRCITSARVAEDICALVEKESAQNGISDMCMTVNSVPRVATYMPGKHDYRDTSALALAS